MIRAAPDGRYQVAREYCGYAQPRWVARFCGAWLDSYECQADAIARCRLHNPTVTPMIRRTLLA